MNRIQLRQFFRTELGKTTARNLLQEQYARLLAIRDSHPTGDLRKVAQAARICRGTTVAGAERRSGGLRIPEPFGECLDEAVGLLS